MTCEKMRQIVPAEKGFKIKTSTFTDGKHTEIHDVMFWGLTEDGVICAVVLIYKEGMAGAAWGEIIPPPQ